jgi:hypothetical protein
MGKTKICRQASTNVEAANTLAKLLLPRSSRGVPPPPKGKF